MKGGVMFNRLLMGAAALSLATTIAFGIDGVKFFVGEGDKSEAYMTMINEKILPVGFVLSDPHEHIENAYKTKWGMPTQTVKGVTGPHPDFDPTFKETLDNLGFFSVANDAVMGPLLMKEPSLGGFSPFNLHIYKVKGEDKTYVGYVMPDTMLDIVGVKDKEVRAKFVETFTGLDKVIAAEIGSKVKMVDYKALPKQPMMTFEVPFTGNAETFKADFQSRFEETFETNKYIIAGYKDMKEAMANVNAKFDRFDQYWVYSLCHFRFSEGIFNRGRPDAGVFAPCSMYMYIDKGTNKMMVGMPRLESWIAVMGIKDKAMVDSILNLDKDVVRIMQELGAKEL